MRGPGQVGQRVMQRPAGSGPGLAWLVLACVMSASLLGAAPLPGPYAKEHAITIDPTALEPPTRWHVPGVTPIIASLDPEYTDAYSTTERQVVTLKPGHYRFGTFTFDFPFEVTLDGVLDFSPSLDHCVDGRDTTTLTIRCSRVQPYTGDIDYYE